jgi:hypothetical protein
MRRVVKAARLATRAPLGTSVPPARRRACVRTAATRSTFDGHHGDQ